LVPIVPGEDLSGRYKIIAPLGEGSMGTVYRALQNDLGREVAIKVISAKHTRTPGATGRFLHEMQVMSRLTHPHIATVLDAGTSDTGHPFYVMELLYGDTLDERLVSHGQQSPPEAACVVTQVLHGVCEAHRLGIVHRDLKPSNIMLCTYATQDDFVKIVDFGLARPFLPQSGSDYVALKDVPTGTIAYMAPEQLRCLPPGPAMDVYAVGHILVELLLGHSPYIGMSAPEVIEAKLGTSPHPFESPIFDGPLGKVVTQAVSNDPRYRYRSAEVMLEDLAIHANRFDAPRSTLATCPLSEPTSPEMPVVPAEALTRTRG